MAEQKIKIRVRLVIIKNNKILLSYTKDEDFYFYIGGKVEFGETLKEACRREVLEECKANFEFKKILYVRDFIATNRLKLEETPSVSSGNFILPEIDEHSVEFYILGNVNKFEEIEGIKDEEFNGRHWQTWVDLDKLSKINIKPKSLTEKIIKSYKKGFSNGTEYVGVIE